MVIVTRCSGDGGQWWSLFLFFGVWWSVVVVVTGCSGGGCQWWSLLKVAKKLISLAVTLRIHLQIGGH